MGFIDMYHLHTDARFTIYLSWTTIHAHPYLGTHSIINHLLVAQKSALRNSSDPLHLLINLSPSHLPVCQIRQYHELVS